MTTPGDLDEDLILFGKPYLLRNAAAWDAHAAQLDDDYGAGCHHGAPEIFPCLVLSRSKTRPNGTVDYFHDVVGVDDACALVAAAEPERVFGTGAFAPEGGRGIVRRFYAYLRGCPECAEEPESASPVDRSPKEG